MDRQLDIINENINKFDREMQQMKDRSLEDMREVKRQLSETRYQLSSEIQEQSLKIMALVTGVAGVISLLLLIYFN